MKKLLSIFAITFLLSSCSKKDVEPALSAKAAGIYTLNSIKLNGKSGSGIGGSINLTATDDEMVDAIVKLTYQGQTESASYIDLSLQTDGSDIDILQDGDLVGTISDKNIIFYIVDGGDTWELKGAK